MAWAWLSIVFFLPIFGTVLYLLFGEYRQPRRRRRRLTAAELSLSQITHPELNEALSLDTEELQLSRAFEQTAGMPALTGNEIHLLPDAAATFASLLQDLNAAHESIDLEFYIWCEGGLADQFAERLLAAARRGVKCRLLVDAIGSRPFVRGKWIEKLRAGGVQVVVALPSGIWRSLIARPDLRIHRKIAVIDGQIAYTGSMNLADPKIFNLSAGVGQWVDAMARIRGAAVQSLHGVFLSDWCAETGEEFARAQPNSFMSAPGGATIQCLPSGPAVKDSAIEQILIMALSLAKSEIILTTPYFVPSEALLYVLMAAARRGVHTTLIVPDQVDSRITQYASRSFLQDLIKAGVQVALYQPGLLHTKSVTIDKNLSLFGSLNLDPRSLRINFEITVAVYDTGFTHAFRQLQHKYLTESKFLTSESIQQQTRRQIWASDFARLAGPLL